MSWNYAELSKMAKKNGGPEVLVEAFIQSRASQGQKSKCFAVMVTLFVSIAIWEGGKWIWENI